MTATPKPKTPGKKTPQNKSRALNTSPVSSKVGFRFQGNDWLIFPLGILMIICAYTFVSTVSSPGSSDVLTQPAIITLLAGIFASLYVYNVLMKRPIRTLAMIIAYIFSIVLLLMVIVLVSTSGHECTGFYGTSGNCSDDSNLVLWLLLFNPMIVILWAPLSIVGIAALLIERKNNV